MFELCSAPFDPSDELRAFTKGVAGAGAIVSFSGLVRAEHDSNGVTNLHLQAYSPMTERGIQSAIDQAIERWQLIDARVIHRIGDMPPLEPIVFVAAAARHRRAAFQAADFLMDYLKTEAVFWKKETRANGEAWIEPRADDHTGAKRWTETDQQETICPE